MGSHNFKAHRCEGSVNSYISIRKYTEKNTSVWKEDLNKWLLQSNEFDLDYDYHYLSTVAEIKYCPFCGERLGDD